LKRIRIGSASLHAWPNGSAFPKAVVAIACKLLIIVGHVLLAKSADRCANAEQVAFKLMVWSWKLTDEQRSGLTSRQFIRAQLIRYILTHQGCYRIGAE
jgi:hypothetical protein